jgi:hypothetical protein
MLPHMDASTVNVRVPRDVRDQLRELADGRPLGVTITRLVKMAGGQLPEPGATVDDSGRPAGGQEE